jgi:hypothetical protein
VGAEGGVGGEVVAGGAKAVRPQEARMVSGLSRRLDLDAAETIIGASR